MNWLIWRQHRKMFIILTTTLILYAALVIPTGLHFWHIYQQALAVCGKTDTCGQLNGNLLESGWDSNLNPSLPGGGVNLVVLLILALPFLLGMFIGVPLIAREYNDSTNLLVWTRSTSRRRWLTTKLVWILISTAIFAAIFAALTTWWSKTGNTLYVNRFNTVKFDLQGMVPVGYSVFAVSLGIALGTWLKRIMVAIGITLVILLASQIVVGSFIRPHYMTPRVLNVGINQNTTSNGNGLALSPQGPPNGGAAWAVSGALVNKSGQPLNWSSPPESCVVTHPNENTGVGSASSHTAVASAGHRQADAIVSQNGGPAVDFQCLNNLGYYWKTQYQPAYRYWDFQRIELGLYLALSLVPLGATYWLVLRRDA
ncbi:MAG TPA: ABC transporter permease [Verrucomicrobiae bacterium]|nr:ABC transporter permease [Verrucomicrobiae bacterium]